METPLNGSMVSGDLIQAEHVTQFKNPLNSMQEAATWYAEATGSVNALEVEYSDLTIDALANGNLFHIKANLANTGAATLKVNDLDPLPITKLGRNMSRGLRQVRRAVLCRIC